MLRGAAELHDDGPHFLREVGMTNQSDSQIGIQWYPTVPLAQRDNVDLIERRNQGPDDAVQTCGFVWHLHLRRLAKKIGRKKEWG